MNAAATFEPGLDITTPKSKVKSLSVLFSPSSMIASLTRKFSDEIIVVSPSTVRFPEMYASPPTESSCCGFEFAIPTFDAVTKLVVVLLNSTVSVVVLPVSVTPCKSCGSTVFPESMISFVITS